MRNCNDYDCLIGLAVDGLLDGPDKEDLDRHLAECAACRRKLADMSAIREALQQPVAVPEGLHDHIMTGVKAHEHKRKLRKLLKTVGSAAAALVLCFTAVRFMGVGSMNMKEDAAMFGAADKSMSAALAPQKSTAMLKPESADGVASDSIQEDKSESTGDHGGSGLTSGLPNEAVTAPTEPAAPPMMTSPAPAPGNKDGNIAAYRVLGTETGEGLIAFTSAWAFHLEVEGDPAKVQDILNAGEASEAAEGYTLLEVSADMELVIKALKDAGISYKEDARNTWAMEGTAPQNGIVSIKIK